MISTTDIYQKYLQCTGVSTDTRRITPGCLFVALRGDKFDGNAFAQQALASGARYALIDDPTVMAQAQSAGLSARCLLVTDSLTALQDLARHHRQTLSIPVSTLR